MDQILFGDIFVNVEQYLFPKDLHILLQTCKKYNKTIIPDRVKMSAINEVKKRLSIIFDKNYVEFIEIMQQTNCHIIGQFITQCLLGEKWNPIVRIYTTEKICDPLLCQRPNLGSNTSNNETENKIIIFMTDKKYPIEYKTCVFRDSQNRQNFIDSIGCKINTTHVNIHSLYGKHDAKSFINDCCEYNANKNIYSFLSDKLYVHKMREIFSKITNVSRFNTLPLEFSRMYRNGFRFYKLESNSIEKLMTSDDIIRSFFDIIKIRKTYDKISGKIIIDKISGKFIIKDNKLSSLKKDTVFDIVEISYCRDEKQDIMYQKLYICDIDKYSETHAINLMYPDITYYNAKWCEKDSETEIIILCVDND